MKKKVYEYNYTLPLIVAVFVLLVLLFVYFGIGRQEKIPAETTEEPSESTTEPTEEETMPPLNFKTDLSVCEAAIDPSDASPYLILVNKTHPLSESYVPKNLTAVKDTSKNIELESTVESALEAMFIEMRADGVANGLFVTSAYRSYDYQNNLFYNVYIPREQAKGLSYEKAKEKVLTYSALPGTSEHQSGLCVDLMTMRMSDLDESFADEPVFAWLSKNAWKFGFILRYPKDKVDITGYDYEPWHYRFVGRAAAYEIWRDGLCLEEYLAK